MMNHGVVTQSRHCVILKLKIFNNVQHHAALINATTGSNLK